MSSIIKESELVLTEIKSKPKYSSDTNDTIFDRLVYHVQQSKSKGSKTGKGILTLDHSSIYFTKRDEVVWKVPIKNIRSANATKISGIDVLEIRYEENGEIGTARFSTGIQSMMFFTNALFPEWAQAINKTREEK